MEFQTKALEVVNGLTIQNKESWRLEDLRERTQSHSLENLVQRQILVQSVNIQECVEYATDPMGLGHALNLNRWKYRKDGSVLSSTSCVFIVWVMDIWDSFVIEQESVELTITRKSTINYYTRLKVIY